MKAHKSEKSFPMRDIVPTIDTPPYEISKYLAPVIQLTLNKKPTQSKKLKIICLASSNMEN